MNVPHSAAVAGALTASGAPRRCQHLYYDMTCADYDELEARAEGRCEICRTETHRLSIDHAHADGWTAVRGLLCPKCNSRLGAIEAGKREPDEATVRYLSNPFRLPAEGRPARPRRRPKRMELVTLRASDELWDAAQAVARARGESLSGDVLRPALERYVKRNRELLKEKDA